MEIFRKTSKNVYNSLKNVYNNSTKALLRKRVYGDAPDSIAGERKDKHTADGVTAQQHSN